jgi:hypothetical protein
MEATALLIAVRPVVYRAQQMLFVRVLVLPRFSVLGDIFFPMEAVSFVPEEVIAPVTRL